MPRTTHTYTVLPISRVAYRELRARLEASGYHHAIHTDADGEVIDLHGVAVQAIEPKAAVDATTDDGDTTTIEVASLLSRRTRAGIVELALHGERTQMDVRKAREVVAMLLGAIEAAISDEAVYTLARTKLGVSEEVASRMLLDLREIPPGHARYRLPKLRILS